MSVLGSNINGIMTDDIMALPGFRLMVEILNLFCEKLGDTTLVAAQRAKIGAIARQTNPIPTIRWRRKTRLLQETGH